jgi:hypothetical protein
MAILRNAKSAAFRLRAAVGSGAIRDRRAADGGGGSPLVLPFLDRSWLIFLAFPALFGMVQAPDTVRTGLARALRAIAKR